MGSLKVNLTTLSRVTLTAFLRGSPTVTLGAVVSISTDVYIFSVLHWLL